MYYVPRLDNTAGGALAVTFTPPGGMSVTLSLLLPVSRHGYSCCRARPTPDHLVSSSRCGSVAVRLYLPNDESVEDRSTDLQSLIRPEMHLPCHYGIPRIPWLDRALTPNANMDQQLLDPLVFAARNVAAPCA